MKYLVIKIILFIFLAGTLNNLLYSQGNLSVCPLICADTTCGAWNVGFSPGGGVVFCEGTPITFYNTGSHQFDYYVFQWSDDSQDLDTLWTGDSIVHIFIIPDSTRCLGDRFQSPCFRGVDTCSLGVSCSSGSYDFLLKVRPLAIINSPGEACINELVNFNSTPCNGEEYLWEFSDNASSTDPNYSRVFTIPGSYWVKLTVWNDCGMDMTTQTVTVVDDPIAIANLTLNPSDTIVCLSNTFSFIDNTVTLGGSTTWSISPIDTFFWCYTDTVMGPNSDTIEIMFKKTGTLMVSLIAENACGTDTWTQIIEVLDSVNVNLDTVPPFCESANYTPPVFYSDPDQIISYLWAFPGSNFPTSILPYPTNISYTQPGTYPVTLTIESACGEQVEYDTIQVDSIPLLSFIYTDTICLGALPDTLIAFPQGGMWSGSGISDTVLGIFHPTTSGNYTPTYTYSGGACTAASTINITVINSIVVTIDSLFLCQDSDPTQIIFNPAEGIFVDSPWISPTGLFDPAISGVGEFEPLFMMTDVNGCNVSQNAYIKVDVFPVISMMDTAIVCNSDFSSSLAEIFQLNIDSLPGVLSWTVNGVPSSGFINAVDSSVSTIPVHVSYLRHDCFVEDSAILSIIPISNLNLSMDTTLCITADTFQLIAFPEDGLWSGDGVIDTTGVVNLDSTEGGLNIYTYNYLPGTSCALQGSVTLDIIDLSSTLNAGSDVNLCFGVVDTFFLSGFFPANGEWTGMEVIDPSAGSIDISKLKSDTTYTYTYCIQDMQVSGCSACDEVKLTVHSLPDTAFSINGSTCIDGIFNSVIDNCDLINSYLWDFGDSSTNATGCDTSHSYGSPGDYTILLIVTDTFGCQNTNDTTIHVIASPIASFTTDMIEGCAPLEVHVTNLSSGENISYLWLLNKDTLSVNTLVDTFTLTLDSVLNDSIFLLELQVSNSCEIKRDTVEVLVHPYPIVDIGVTYNEECSPYHVTFGNATSGNADQWFWDLGVGHGTSLDSVPLDTIIYTTPSNIISIYTVTLTATNECGSGSDTVQFQVNPPDIEAFISLGPTNVCPPYVLTPSSISTPGSTISWDIIDPNGVITNNHLENPDLVLDIPGLYTIILKATRCGTASDTGTILVLPYPGLALSHDPIACVNEEIQFFDESTNAGGVQWFFGDGDSSFVGNPLHSYDTAGTFDITLIGYSTLFNCPDTLTSQITIHPLPQIQIDTSPVSGCPPLSVTFKNTGLPSLHYAWFFGDTSNPSFDFQPTHIFDSSGQYIVNVFAFDDVLCYSDTVQIEVNVFIAPESLFNIKDTSLCQFHDTLFVQNESLNADSFDWLINDSTFTGQNIAFLPLTFGPHVISLITGNIFGCRDTAIQTVVVMPSPISDFATDVTEGCVKLKVSFQNKSISATDFIWNFGDMNTSLADNPINIYSNDGQFTASLIANNDNGCPSDTFILDIEVFPLPTASFEFLKDMECGAPMNVQFQNLSIDNAGNFWMFGDNGISNSTSPSHLYEQAGSYTATLIVENIHNCFDTIVQLLDIFEQPIALFALGDQAFCEGDTIIFINTSLHGNQFEWFQNNQLFSTETEPQLEVNESGQFQFSLVVHYNAFCSDTLDLAYVVNIYDSPTADFTYTADPAENILGDVYFQNQSIDFTSVFWKFGDGITSVQLDPVHEYDINRSVFVTLVAVNDNGGVFTCIDSIVKPVDPEWLTRFFAPNAFSPDHGTELVRQFLPVGTGIQEYEINVFSPWGEHVWTSKELNDGHPDEAWNGKMNNTGEDLPQGAFSWIVKLTFVDGSSSVRNGSVTLLR